MNVKRPIVYFLGSLIVGIIIAYSEAPLPFKLFVTAIAIFLCLKSFFEGKINKVVLLFILLFMVLGFIRFSYEKVVFDGYTKIVENFGKGTKTITGRIESRGHSTNSNYYIISNCELDGEMIGTCRCYFNDKLDPNAKIGNYIKVLGSLSTIDAPQNEGEFNQRDYYRSSGISFISYAKDFTIINKRYDVLKQNIYKIKVKIKDQIKKIFNEKDAGLFTAMITGDKSSIDIEQKRLFSDNGIAHILAISGLHLSILGLCLFEFLRKKFSINVSAGIVSIFILFYGIFIDAGATSLRAITMLYIRFVALSIGRVYDSKNTLYIICFIFLMLHPYLLFNAGFQFSYVAIFALNEKVVIKIRKKEVKVPAVITLTLFLFPITIYHYFTYPLYSLLLNLAIIPLMSFVLGFGLLSLIVSFLFVPLGKIFAYVVHVIFLIYDKLCYIVEKLPYHILWLGKPTLYAVLFYYIAIFLIIYALSEKDEDLYHDDSKLDDFFEKLHAINLRPVLCILLLILSIGIMFVRVRPDFRMTFLSIGQGDAILIESKDKILSIDGGSTSNKSAGEYSMAPHIKSRAIKSIDYAFISHPDADHTNAILYLLNEEDELHIKNLVLPINAKIETKFEKLIDAAIFKGTNILYMKEKDVLNVGDIRIDVLSPDEKTIADNPHKKKKEQLDANEMSLTFKLSFGDYSALFTGDIGTKTIDRLINDDYAKKRLDVDVFKVPHHGSKNSLSINFYKLLSPRYAVVSYGKGNSYGHPHKVVIDALFDENMEILEPAKNGQIDIYFNKTGINTKSFN